MNWLYIEMLYESWQEYRWTSTDQRKKNFYVWLVDGEHNAFNRDEATEILRVTKERKMQETQQILNMLAITCGIIAAVLLIMYNVEMNLHELFNIQYN